MRPLLALLLLTLAGCASPGPVGWPNAELRPASGVMPHLQTATLQERTLVVGLLNPYCAYCKGPFRDLDAALARYREDPQVAVLLVYAWRTDENPSPAIASFTRRYGIETPAYWDATGNFVRRFPVTGSTARPTSPTHASAVEQTVFVVNPRGDIVFRRAGNYTSERTRAELFAAIEQARSIR